MSSECITDNYNVRKHYYVGDFDQDRYIFCNKENGNSTIRVTSGGFWKLATGLDKQITCLKWMPIVGIKRTFIFYKGKNSRVNSRTDWLMHEYHIVHVGNTQSTNSQVTFTGLSLILWHSNMSSIDPKFSYDIILGVLNLTVRYIRHSIHTQVYLA